MRALTRFRRVVQKSPIGARSEPSERGAVAVFVGASILILVGLTALTVDMGRNQAERRRLTGAVDASALAAAQAYSEGLQGCDAVAKDFLERNADDAVFVDCEAFGDTTDGTYGWVIVDAQLKVDQVVAGVIGLTDTTLIGRSVAQFGAPGGRVDGGMRPLGLCLAAIEGFPEYQAWQADDPTQPSAPFRLSYNKAHPNHCGSTTGNWGFVDFDGGGTSNSDTVDWINDGYPGTVELGWFEGDTGALSGSHRAALQSLVDSGERFWLPVFDNAQGRGANTEYEIVNFFGLRLVGMKTTGSQKSRFIEIVLDPAGLEASCCEPPGDIDNGARVTGLLALDEDGEPIGLSESTP